MYTTIAPTTRNKVNKPSAMGRLSVTSGIRAAPIEGSVLFGVPALALPLKSVPQTGQRVALSARRVPQVGQICVF
jgi:hypothetical protein